MGCDNCSTHVGCLPSSFEFSKRATLLKSKVYTGESDHNDICKYQLHMQASTYTFKSPLGQINANDIFKRIENITHVVGQEESEHVFHIPEALKLMIGEEPVHKIEWFLDGHYLPVTSHGYNSAILNSKDLMRVSMLHKIPPKLVDTLNLNDYLVGYKMWVESVKYPMMQINHTGSGLWRDGNYVCYMTVRMMTVVISYNHSITATVITRGKIINL